MHPPVLLVGNFLSGSRRYRLACEELAQRLAARGWTLYTTSEKPGRLMRLLDMTASAWRWRKRYAVAEVDVFSGPAFVWAWSTCWLLRRARKPYVLTLRGGDLPRFAKTWSRAVRTLLRSAFAVSAPSRYLFEQMAEHRADLLLIPNALDIGAYTFRLRERPRPELLWLRAFHQVYNPALAVEVLAGLLPEFPEARLRMVGPDRGDGSLQRTRETAERLGVAARVEIVPGVAKEDVPRVLASGDVFLNTTNVDNTPVSVMEAMASGLCIVSTDVGGVPALLENGSEALLVPPREPGAMAAAVGRLLREEGLAGRLSAAARARAESWDWGKVLPQWEELLTAAGNGHA